MLLAFLLRVWYIEPVQNPVGFEQALGKGGQTSAFSL
jgi:hypothetical protein